MNFVYTILVLSLCGLLCLDAVNIEDQKVIGGGTASLASVYYHVGVQLRTSIDGYSTNCGGTIISLGAVLTGGFCLFTETTNKKYEIVQPNQLRVISDTVTLTNPAAQYRLVRTVIPHENYTFGVEFNNDIGLLILATNFEQTTTLRPIPLRSNISVDDELCALTGYGATSNGGPASNTLIRANVPIYPHITCVNLIGVLGDRIVTDNMICAGGNDRAPCDGDAGGPLVCNGELAGIVTLGNICWHPYYLGVFTEVAKYLDWIDAEAEKNGLKL